MLQQSYRDGGSAFTTVPTTVDTSQVQVVKNVDTPTLNTDVIASISRDGSNFTTATLKIRNYRSTAFEKQRITKSG